MNYSEIKPYLLAYWKNFHLTNKGRFRDNASLVRFQKRNIQRIKAGTDLIDLRDIISELYEYTNKDKNESFLEFRNSGKIIDSFYKRQTK